MFENEYLKQLNDKQFLFKIQIKSVFVKLKKILV